MQNGLDKSCSEDDFGADEFKGLWYKMLAKNITPNLSRHSNFSKGKDIWNNTLHLTALAAQKVRSSLGPNGAYKMVTYNRGPERIVKVTKDAVPILEELAIQYPTLALLSEAAKQQRQEIGDGVTSFVILASSLLKKADELIAKKVHPNIILDGYSEAAKEAVRIIEISSEKLERDYLQRTLENVDCGRGLLTAELRNNLVESSEIVNAGGAMDKTRIRIIRKKSGEASETELIKGIILKKAKLHPNMSDEIENPRIVATSGRIGLNRVEIKMPGEGRFNMKFNIENQVQLTSHLEAEKEIKRLSLEKLNRLGVNALFCQQPIDNFVKSKLLEMDVLAFDSVDREDLISVSKAAGANLICSIDDLQEHDVGQAEKLRIENFSPEEIVELTVPGYATFILRGSTAQVLDELELLIRNSLALLQISVEDRKVVPSCGAMEARIARELKQFALKFGGKEQLAVDGFAEALMEIPRCLAENNGANPGDTITQLVNFHSEGYSNYGVRLDGSCGTVGFELSQAKSVLIKRAYEFVSLLLRIDAQITRKEIVKFHKKQ